MSASESREEKSRKIAANAALYKVCEGCDSIVGVRTVLCPNCHSFRFDDSVLRVVVQAKKLGAREQHSVTASDLM
jgi:RNA polymerase subunit RPABC4/transcription elongation factor Spt4